MRTKLLVFSLLTSLFLQIYTETSAQTVQWALQGTVTTEPFHSGLAVFSENINGKTLYGAINTSGEVAIKPQFEQLRSFYNGMAVAKRDTLYGIVSSFGTWILPPTYKNIDDTYKIHGGYIVKDTTNHEGLFYNGQFIIPLQYKNVYAYDWPFCSFTDKDDKRHSLNIYTGDVYHNCSFWTIGNYRYTDRKDSIVFFDSETGERAVAAAYMKSSKGLELFKDNQSDLYGFRNSITNEVVIPPKYQKRGRTPSIWTNDVIVVFDSLSKEIPYHCEVIGSDGHIILSANDDTRYSVKGNYIEGVKDIGTDGGFNLEYSLFTLFGKPLIKSFQHGFLSLIEGTDNWFNISVQDPNSVVGWRKQVFDAVEKKYYPGEGQYNEGIILVHDYYISGKHDYYYINADKRKRLPGKYNNSTIFKDGIALVEQGDYPNNKQFLIDKNGNVVLRLNSKYSCSLDSYFSEGVIGVTDKTDYPYVKGYIYNPLGHQGYTYRPSSNMRVDDNLYDRWMSEGTEAFQKEHWGVAKDYFYRVMMNKPENVEAITYYGGCLNNLGYLEEAIEAYDIALDIEPGYALAKEWRETTVGNIQNQTKEAERSARSEERSNMFWNALNSFSNMLGAMSSTMNGYSTSYMPDMPLTRGPSASGGGNYQQQYQRWESLAARHYNSLTNLGYSSRRSDGSTFGGTLHSMNGGSYVQMKRSLREAQREMARIRREAALHGVTIQQSKWETATVNY